MDISRFLPINEYNAAIGANSPSASNVFATMNDLAGISPGIYGGSGSLQVGDTTVTMAATDKLLFESLNGPYDLFTIDATTNRIGIGIASPGHTLHMVSGNMFIQNGYAAIGTTTPSAGQMLKISAGDSQVTANLLQGVRIDLSPLATAGALNAWGVDVRHDDARSGSGTKQFFMFDANYVGSSASAGTHTNYGIRSRAVMTVGGTANVINIAGYFEAANGTTNVAMQIVDGTEGAGKVLQSDANGRTTWVAPSSLSGVNGIYGGSGTVPTATVATLTDSLTLKAFTNNSNPAFEIESSVGSGTNVFEVANNGLTKIFNSTFISSATQSSQLFINQLTATNTASLFVNGISSGKIFIFRSSAGTEYHTLTDAGIITQTGTNGSHITLNTTITSATLRVRCGSADVAAYRFEDVSGAVRGYLHSSGETIIGGANLYSGVGLTVNGINASNNSFQVTDTSDNIDFRVTGNGNVGIGNTVPESQLQVQGMIRAMSTTPPALTTGKSIEFYFNAGSDQGRILAYDRDTAQYKDMVIGNGATPNKFTIFKSGNVGIGTEIDAGAKLSVRALSTGTNKAFVVRNSADSSDLLKVQGNGRVAIGNITTPAAKLQILGEGTTTGIGLRVTDSGGLRNLSIFDSGQIVLGRDTSGTYGFGVNIKSYDNVNFMAIEDSGGNDYYTFKAGSMYIRSAANIAAIKMDGQANVDATEIRGVYNGNHDFEIYNPVAAQVIAKFRTASNVGGTTAGGIVHLDMANNGGVKIGGNQTYVAADKFSVRNASNVYLFNVLETGNVSIGTATATSKLTVNGDIETLGNTNGIIFADRTDGNRYRTYTDGGVLHTELVP